MKVRVNSKYRYDPVALDRLHPPYGVINGWLKPNDTVKVVNKYGCPPANTMGHCYIESLDGKFLGLVCTNSLTK
jgi:hypothetical protein